MGWVLMSEREVHRVEVLSSVVAGRLRLDEHPLRVSHETIYQYAYSKDGHEIGLYRRLPGNPPIFNGLQS